MNVLKSTLRNGFRRGRIELRQTLTSMPDLIGQLATAGFLVLIMFFGRNHVLTETGVAIGVFMLPSVIGMNFGFSGIIGMAQLLTVEREDGTLLRAKTLPGGMPAYLVGKVIAASGTALFGSVAILLPSLLFLRGLSLSSPRAWLILALVSVLGLAATLPLGAILGAVVDSPRSIGLMLLPVMGLVGISGIFFPLSAMPGWLRVTGQLSPLYWVGLGTRSALLPSGAAAHEVGGSWRTPETLGALCAWAIIGFLVAPIVLRRMARRESGSAVAARRERALARG